MQAHDIARFNSRLANAQNLQSVEFTLSQLAGTGNLTPLGRRWLFFLVALVRMGYEGIRAPMSAIVKAQYRSQGQTTSERSAYRGLAELELSGYIRRQKFRIGKNRFSSIIHFDLERFAYWTRGPAHIKPVTPDYINLHLPKWQRTEVTSSGSRVNSLNSSSNVVKEHPRATNTKERFEKASRERREHPILYSLRMATAGRGPRVRKPVLELARYELANPKERESGAPWEKWLQRNQETGRIAFEELSIPHERETVVNEQFLPYFEGAMGLLQKITKPIKTLLRRETKPRPRLAPAQDFDQDETPQATPDEIKDMISTAGLEHVLEPEEPQETMPGTAAAFKRRVESTIQDRGDSGPPGLSDDDLRILESARLRAIGARANR